MILEKPHRDLILWLAVALCAIVPWRGQASAQELRLSLPDVAVSDIAFSLTVEKSATSGPVQGSLTVTTETSISTNIITRSVALDGVSSLQIEGLVLPASGSYIVKFDTETGSVTQPLRVLPGVYTVLPPLIAIAFALIFRQVLLALAAGGFLGALLLSGYNPFIAILRHADQLVLESVTSRWNASVLLVIIILGGMIGVITRNGSVYGVVNLVTGWARTPRSGQIATMAMGLVIFFEGFVNTLVVGNTMRPVTDRLRISREKLSFIVDATAAPVASIALISGWIGFEVGLIGDALQSVDLTFNPYVTFIETIPYRFYPILMLFFVFFIAYQKRDFGPMYQAELRSRTTGKLLADDAVSLGGDENALRPIGDRVTHWGYAFLPLLVVIGVTFWGMWSTGVSAISDTGGDVQAASLWSIFGQGNGSVALLWGSVCGAIAAVAATVGFRLLSVSDCIGSWIEGVKSVLLAVVILILAWALVAACKELRTADYIVALTTGSLSPEMLPALTFIVSALVSFATGTSWGTMALMMPLVVPLSVGLSTGEVTPGSDAYVNLLATISGVLSGAVWGDHCSPISDTTIMSSMASGADHVDHVSTQAPYALVVGIVSIVLGDLPAAYGLSPWISLVAGAAALFLIIRIVGRPTDVNALPPLSPETISAEKA